MATLHPHYPENRRNHHATYILMILALLVFGGVGVTLSGLSSDQGTGTSFGGFTMQNVSRAELN